MSTKSTKDFGIDDHTLIAAAFCAGVIAWDHNTYEIRINGLRTNRPLDQDGVPVLSPNLREEIREALRKGERRFSRVRYAVATTTRTMTPNTRRTDMDYPTEQQAQERELAERREVLRKKIEKYWPSSDGYNDTIEDVDRSNTRKGGGVW